MYRKAVDNYKDSLYINQYSKILICGFNALNKAETIIFSDLVKEKKQLLFMMRISIMLKTKAMKRDCFFAKTLVIPG